MDPYEHTSQVAAESLAANDPTGWFERLYAMEANGDAVIPWNRGVPQPLLVEWAEREAERADGTGRTAIVVGCGLGEDAEFVARLGFDTAAFDLSETAIERARRAFPDSRVRYRAADMFELPSEWTHGFDLVVECFTVQSLPVELHDKAIEAVRGLVAPGGTLLVIAAAQTDLVVPPPPWPLTRAEIEAFGSDGLRPVRIEDMADLIRPEVWRWRAEFSRPAHDPTLPTDL